MYIHYIDLSDYRDIKRSYNIHTQLVIHLKYVYVYIYIYDIYICDKYIYILYPDYRCFVS